MRSARRGTFFTRRRVLVRRLLMIAVGIAVCALVGLFLVAYAALINTRMDTSINNDSGYPCLLEASRPLFPVDLKTHKMGPNSVIIARSALLLRPNGVYLQLLVLQTCQSSRKAVRLQINGREVLCASAVHVVSEKCPWEWAKSCEWSPFVLTALLPEAPKNIRIFRGENSINLRYEWIRQRGDLKLAVCIQPLYWFADWLEIIEFVEAWVSQGADHFFFYYHTISERTLHILKHYESEGLVTLIPWKSFPASDEADPNKSVYRLAHTLANNDCLLRAMIARFVAFVDVDEFVIANGTTLFELLDYKDRRCSVCGGYAMSHAKLYYRSFRPTGAFKWANLTMEWLSGTRASKPDNSGPRKIIYRPERIHVVSVHDARAIYPKYVVVRLEDSEVALFHARHTWTNKIPSNEKLVPDVIPSSIRHRILAGYENVMASMMALNKSATVVLNSDVQNKVQQCIDRWKELGCKMPNTCAEEVVDRDRWMYADNVDNEHNTIGFQVV